MGPSFDESEKEDGKKTLEDMLERIFRSRECDGKELSVTDKKFSVLFEANIEFVERITAMVLQQVVFTYRDAFNTLLMLETADCLDA